MAKRFFNPDWKKLRALPGYMQRIWFYIWDQADSAGVYHFDEEYIKLDLKLKEQVRLEDLARLPECEILAGERVLIKNFLVVNYGKLKPDYNPHKPAFRDIERNGLTLNSSLNEACPKLEEEDEDKEEDKLEGSQRETFIVTGEGIVPDMAQVFIQRNPEYPFDQTQDYPQLRQLAAKILVWLKHPKDITNGEYRGNILKRWGELVIHCRSDNHYSTYSITRINKHFQSIVQSFTNGNQRAKTGQNGSYRPIITGEATGAGSIE